MGRHAVRRPPRPDHGASAMTRIHPRPCPHRGRPLLYRSVAPPLATPALAPAATPATHVSDGVPTMLATLATPTTPGEAPNTAASSCSSEGGGAPVGARPVHLTLCPSPARLAPCATPRVPRPVHLAPCPSPRSCPVHRAPLRLASCTSMAAAVCHVAPHRACRRPQGSRPSWCRTGHPLAHDHRSCVQALQV